METSHSAAGVYAGGMMSDWGVHLNDIVLWALDAKGPQTVCTTGGIFTTDDDRDTPDTLQVVYEFPGTMLTYSMRKGNGLKFDGHDHGILFCGSDGSLLLDRSGFEVIPDTTVLPYGIRLAHGDRPIRKISLQHESAKGVNGQGAHVRNFLDCFKSRALPASDIEIAHRSTNTCHLGNIALKVGHKLAWDTETETFKNDSEANTLLSANHARDLNCPTSESFCGVSGTRRSILDETFYRSNCEIDRPRNRGRRYSRANALDPDRSNRRSASRAILFPPGLDHRGRRFRDLDDRHHPDLLAATSFQKAVEHRGGQRTETLTTSRPRFHDLFPRLVGQVRMASNLGIG